MNELEIHLERFGRRLRLRGGWLLAQRTFWMAALSAVLIQLTGRVFPVEKLWLWTSLPFLVWLLSVILYSLLKPHSLMQIARQVDLELSLKERLSTALAFQSSTGPFSERTLSLQQAGASAPGNAQLSGRISLSTPGLAHLQRNDALSVAAAIVPEEAFVLNWLVRPLAAGAILLVMLLASSILPNPQTLVLRQRAELEQTAKEQAMQIEKARQEIEASQEISPEMKEEILRQLAELAKNLEHNPGDLEQALADLSKLEQDLKRLQDPRLASRQALLEVVSFPIITGYRRTQEPGCCTSLPANAGPTGRAAQKHGRHAAPGAGSKPRPGSLTSRAIRKCAIIPGAGLARPGSPIR